MSGVRQVGTRLDQLVVLRDRITYEIETERRNGRHNGHAMRDIPSSAEALMNTLGVTSRDVKEWAVERGLLTAVRRGRVSLAVVQAYQKEHEQT
jgi:hypothetical protein